MADNEKHDLLQTNNYFKKFKTDKSIVSIDN